MSDQQPALSHIRLGPVVLHGATVVLRPPRIADYEPWRRIRLRDRSLIEPFWSSSPLDWSERHTAKLWVRECLAARGEARTGRRAAMVIEVDGRFAGQIELISIDTDTCSAELGVWVDAEVARHGIGGLAAAMVLDFGFGSVGLQRITAPISPANVATASGAARLGFQREALMTRYFDAGGARRDHELWAITAAMVPPGGFAATWIRRYHAAPMPRTQTADRTDPPVPGGTVIAAAARYYAGRMLHSLDPLRAPRVAPLSDQDQPCVVLRTRRLTDGRRWRAARLRARAVLDPNTGAPQSEWAAEHSRARWLRELLRARPGLRSAAGLVLAIEVGGAYVGECRLFDLDMFDRNARMFVWTDPALGGAGERVRTAATRLLVAYAFGALGLCRIDTAIEPEDREAAAVATRIGMVWEGRMSQFVGATGRRADHDLWALTVPVDPRHDTAPCAR
ncbi:GNAT family N-acetyltransferase [Nocardia lijiangensis]|uniref:GNAT family N-acetyltransferase n=1 Tax=Nocardia lijiangensis TaxID=299618 RepID=UPI0008349DD9|nr:GNAT family protein [Nocardia lijiangensis]